MKLHVVIRTSVIKFNYAIVRMRDYAVSGGDSFAAAEFDERKVRKKFTDGVNIVMSAIKGMQRGNIIMSNFPSHKLVLESWDLHIH